MDESASLVGIAVAHSSFNIVCTSILLPMSSLLEKLAIRLVPDKNTTEIVTELDERLLATPPIALDCCNNLVCEMAESSISALKNSMNMLKRFDAKEAEKIQEAEEKADHYEDILGTYLVKLSGHQISDNDSSLVSKILKVIGDLERISDHSINILESAEELEEKNIDFSDEAKRELHVLCSAVSEILTLAYVSFVNNDLEAAKKVEPLEQVIDKLRKKLRNSHITRLKDGDCSIEAGFVWADLITNLERTADHCSNIAVCVIDATQNNMNVHESVRSMKEHNPYYDEQYHIYEKQYELLP